MDRPSDETIWQMVAGVASAIVAAVLSLLGIQYRTYRKDRRTLYTLRREMDEVNVIRQRTDDGRRALSHIDQLTARIDTLAIALETVVERQDHSEENQTAMLTTLSKIDEKTDMMWELMKSSMK